MESQAKNRKSDENGKQVQPVPWIRDHRRQPQLRQVKANQ